MSRRGGVRSTSDGMCALVNDALRRGIGWGMTPLGMFLTLLHQLRLASHPIRSRSSRRRYRLQAEDPILRYGPDLERGIERIAATTKSAKHWVLTSGSTTRPKRLFYTPSRLRRAKWAFAETFLRMVVALGIRSRSLYVFSALGQGGDSLTAQLLRERKPVSYLETLQAPYRIHSHPALQRLASTYGTPAVRLWVLALSNPGVLYSTNPSTLALFLDALFHDWKETSRLARDFHLRRSELPRETLALARRLQSRGAEERIAAIAGASHCPGFAPCVPGVRAYVCWTGGYVRPFLDQIATYLPPPRYRLVPMYSMSTETIETVASFQEGDVAFHPLASGVLYEFLEEGSEEGVQSLRATSELEVGKVYAMVVSDRYGLRRYHTDDLFECQRLVRGLPDLRFVGRQSLSYSFTGEKLTGDQLLEVFASLRQERGELLSRTCLTMVPSKPEAEPRPHYKLLLIDVGGPNGSIPGAGPEDGWIAERGESLLREVNREYASKVESGRLSPLKLQRLSLNGFLALVGPHQHQSWEAQFKFLPLYRRTWESLHRSARLEVDERECSAAR